MNSATDSEGWLIIWGQLPPGGLCYFYSQMIFLFDEEAVTIVGKRDPNLNVYRFNYWLYDYLEENPELLETSGAV